MSTGPLPERGGGGQVRGVAGLGLGSSTPVRYLREGGGRKGETEGKREGGGKREVKKREGGEREFMHMKERKLLSRERILR
jgi:hypothetical protein